MPRNALNAGGLLGKALGYPVAVFDLLDGEVVNLDAAGATYLSVLPFEPTDVITVSKVDSVDAAGHDVPTTLVLPGAGAVLTVTWPFYRVSVDTGEEGTVRVALVRA